MAKYDLKISVDVSQYTSATAPSIGLKSGVFYWATGNTTGDYVGGLIVDGSVDTINRAVDISETGGFFSEGSAGWSLSGSLHLQDTVEAYGISFTSCPVVIYQGSNAIFTGVVDSVSSDEKEWNFSASIDATNIQKNLPTKIITVGDWPNANSDVIGSSYPVVLGNVRYSPGVSAVDGYRALYIGHRLSNGRSVYAYPIAVKEDNYSVDGTTEIIISADVVTIGPVADEWDGKYIKFISGAGKPQRIYRIKSAVRPPDSATSIVIYGYLGDTPTNINNDHGYPAAEPQRQDASRVADTWWYQIVDGDFSVIFSNLPTLTALVDLAQFNGDETVESAIIPQSIENTDYLIVKNPSYSIVSDDGESPLILPHQIYFSSSTFSSQEGVTYTSSGSVSDARDRNYDTETTLTPIGGLSMPDTITKGYQGLTKEGVPNLPGLFLAMDAYIGAGISAAYIVEVRWYGQSSLEQNLLVSVAIGSADVSIMSPIPVTYYTSGGAKPYDLIDSFWFTSAVKNMFAVPDDIVSGLHSGKYIDAQVTFKINVALTGVDDVAIAIRELCFLTEGESVSQFKYWCSGLDGEAYDSASTNTIETAISHLADTYLGVGVPTFSGSSTSWHVGKTITKPASGLDLISEISKTSFAAFFPNGAGDNIYNHWISNTTIAHAFDETNIFRDSIGEWRLQSSNDCYNDFKIQYDYDYAVENYRKIICITKAEQSAFPAITGDWTSFVSGIGIGSSAYAAAKTAWEYARASYLAIGATRPMPAEMGQCSWYTDPTWLGDTADETLSAWKFAALCAYWFGLPKRVVSFEVSRSILTTGVELLQYATFSDAEYTRGQPLGGWITDISIDQDHVRIGMMFAPGYVTEDKYIETGSTTDDIIESGDQTTNIIEG